MIAAAVEPIWSRGRWLSAIFLILILQVILIFGLSSRRSEPPVPTRSDPMVYLPANSVSGWPDLSSPTLFVLANRRGFSGSAWMEIPILPYDLPKWIDPAPPVVTNPVAQLGSALGLFVRTNLADIYELAARVSLEPGFLPPLENRMTERSTLSVEDDLSQRPLLTAFNLPSWPGSEILTNSVILAGVDPSGNVFSAVILADGKSGSKDADANALRQASAARFTPLHQTDRGIQWGRLIFHWHTMAQPATNINVPANLPPGIRINPYRE